MVTRVALVNDSFTGADANPIGGIYSTLNDTGIFDIQRLSHVAQPTFGIAINGCSDTTNAYANNQYVAITPAAWSSSDAINALVRVNHATGGFIRWALSGAGNTGSRLDWFTNSSTTGIISASINLSIAAAVGDVFEIDAVVQQDGITTSYTLLHTPVSTSVQYTVGVFTDGHLLGGGAGFSILNEGAPLSRTAIGNFTAGNLVFFPLVFAIT